MLCTAGAACLLAGTFEHPALLRGTSPAAAPCWDHCLSRTPYVRGKMSHLGSPHPAGSGMWVLEEGRGHGPSLGTCELRAKEGGSCLRFTRRRDGAMSKQSRLCNCGKDRHKLLL